MNKFARGDKGTNFSKENIEKKKTRYMGFKSKSNQLKIDSFAFRLQDNINIILKLIYFVLEQIIIFKFFFIQATFLES